MASEIRNITIRNIKGYGDVPVVLPVELKSNRVNLIFAPNGTGKSSFAAAFNLLNRARLDVPMDYKHQKNEFAVSELSLQLDGVQYRADRTQNEIASVLDCQIINSPLYAHAVHHNRGRFHTVSGYEDIRTIEIENIVRSVSIGYAVTPIKREFGTNGKILRNLQEDFSTKDIFLALPKFQDAIDTWNNSDGRKELIEEVRTYVNSLDGTEDEIRAQLDDATLEGLEHNNKFQEVAEVLQVLYPADTRWDMFDRFYQLLYLWHNKKEKMKSATNYHAYIYRKEKIDEDIRLLGATWKGIHTQEKDGKLIVDFPHADEISNGQRDLLTFVIDLIKFKVNLKQSKKSLLIIDEVFDYLDDANLIAAQYYLTSLLDVSKENIFMCVLSHLNPYTFRSYVFSDKKINVTYLKESLPTATNKMMAFISFRQDLDKNVEAQKQLYDDISHNLLHYCPGVVDYSVQMNSLKQNRQLDVNYGKTNVLHTMLINELNKYLSQSPSYDPYAVALALRLGVEKKVYQSLPPERQQGFVDAFTTKGKFDYCIESEIIIPDAYYIVTAIHNESDHLRFDGLQQKYIERPMVYKLQNAVIRGIIAEIFGWKGLPLTTSVID